jgi:excisionase family DNA binding protein
MLSAFERRVERELSEIKEMMRERFLKPLTVGEAAKYMGVSKGHVYKLTSEGEVAFYKPNGKRIYFSKDDLDQWIMRRRVVSGEELAESRGG